MNARPTEHGPGAPALQKNDSLLSKCSRDAAPAAADGIDDLLWAGEGTESSDPEATAAVAEEVFMQHVTRVYKVNKQVWDYYSRLAAQQAQHGDAAVSTTPAIAGSGVGDALSSAVAWDDPTAFRFRSTFDDMPAGLLPQQRTLATISVHRGNAPGSLATISKSIAALSRPLTAVSRPLTAASPSPTPRRGSTTPSINGGAAAVAGTGQFTRAAVTTAGADAEAGRYYLQLRPSVFCLPVMSPEHKVAWVWSLLMLFMDMVYIAFAMPLSAAFCPVVLGGLNWCSTVDLAAGLLYCLNLAVSFQIGFVLEHDYKKRLLLDGLHVARFYIVRGSFFIDGMAVLPVAYQVVMVSLHIENYWANRCLTFTMFLRLLRLVQLMKLLFVDSLITSGTNGMSRYISVLGQYALVALYAIAVLVHNLACLAWLVALVEGLENSWATKVTWAGGPGGLLYASVSQQYLAAIYWVVTTATGTGYGDITPNSPGDVLISMLFMLCGVGMVALLIGSIAELLTQATSDARRAHAFRQKLTEVNEWMQRRNLPFKLSRAVLNYYNQVWLQHRDHPTEARILSELPPYLRGRVASHITAELLDGVDVTWGLDQAVKEQLASRLVPVEVAPGHELCREGDEADCLWLLQEGELIRMQAHTHQVDLIQPPCWLGESCLLTEEYPQLQQRPATLRALSSCQLWQLSLREARTLMTSHPDLGQRMLQTARQAVSRLLDSNSELCAQQQQHQPHLGASRPYNSDSGRTAENTGFKPLSTKSVPIAQAAVMRPGSSVSRPMHVWSSSNIIQQRGPAAGAKSVPAATALMAHHRLEPMITSYPPPRRTSGGLPDLAARSVPAAAAYAATAALTQQVIHLRASSRDTSSSTPATRGSRILPPLAARSVPAAAAGGDAPPTLGEGGARSSSRRALSNRAAPMLHTILSGREVAGAALAGLNARQLYTLPSVGPRSPPSAAATSTRTMESSQLPTSHRPEPNQHSGSMDVPSAFITGGLAVVSSGEVAVDDDALPSPHSGTTRSSTALSGMHGT